MTRRERWMSVIEGLRDRGTGPKRSLGQNFLVADGVIEKILATATDPKPQPPTAFLEIGPGLGALTEDLIANAKRTKVPFSVIELDRDFAANWRERFQETGSRVFEADALQLDWSEIGLPSGARLISNLPYQISSSIVVDRSVEPFGITTMVLMFQKEVAKRIAAKPKTDDYGLLSVIAQIGWTVETVCEAGPQDFFPAPRVASRVLRFRRRADAPARDEFAAFLKFTKLAYAHRRKLLVGNISSFGPREGLEAAVVAMGFTKTVRAEEFSPEQLLHLFRALR